MPLSSLLLAGILLSAAPISPRLLVPRRDTPVRAAVRFKERIGPKDLDALRRAGARPVELAVGGFAVVGRVASTDVLQADLHQVARVRGVVRIDPVVPLVRVAPLEVTAKKVGAPMAWSPPQVDERYAGAGIVVADHEGGWNIFHPDFFFLDGGRYDFEDRDGDGRAGAGDALDLDGDGTAEAILNLLDGVAEDIYTGERIETLGYQPDVDWLYVDLDGNGRRDFGAAFSESTPGLSEPTFVGDDVDHDGNVERYEKLLRLGTSKVIAVVVEGSAFRRGQNLAQYPAESFDLSHGTGAVGIVSAGAIGYRRYTGIAPEAELVLIAASDPVAGLATAGALGAHVSFYEWDSPTDPQDGSGPFETALSDAAAEGMVQLAAVGNLANADHVMELIDLSGTRRVDLTTDNLGFYQYRNFWLNLHWNAPQSALSIRVRGSSGDTLELDGPNSEGVLDGIAFTAFAEETAHGNGSVLIVGSTLDGDPLPTTMLGIEVTTTSAAVPRVRGVLFDDQSGWGKGVSWLSDRTDAGSALMPSTSDTVIAVGAYGGRHDFSQFGWGGVDEHRTYSGMGPRVDGARVVDIAAPDDPFSPSASGDPTVFYGSFGGTSGALPHTAGAAAVVLSSGVPFSHAAVESLLTENARSDPFTGALPNEAFGFGKVDLGRALFGATYVDPAPPSIKLETIQTAVVDRPLIIVAAVTQPGGNIEEVQLAWDLGYDGVEEQPLSGELRFTTTPTAAGLLRVVGRAKNSITGRTVRALFATEVVESCDTIGCSAGCCGEDGLCAACPPPLPPDDAGVAGDAATTDPKPDTGVLVINPRRKSGCSCSAHSDVRTGDGALGLLLLSAALLLRRARGGSPRC